LPAEVRVELAIAMSGARLDLGQTQQALAELEIPELDPATAFAYSPALFDAYATVLEELGRDDEAARWYELSERASDALDQAENPGDVDVIEVIELEDDADDQVVPELVAPELVEPELGDPELIEGPDTEEAHD
jgi:hypothetical protein